MRKVLLYNSWIREKKKLFVSTKSYILTSELLLLLLFSCVSGFLVLWSFVSRTGKSVCKSWVPVFYYCVCGIQISLLPFLYIYSFTIFEAFSLWRSIMTRDSREVMGIWFLRSIYCLIRIWDQLTTIMACV